MKTNHVMMFGTGAAFLVLLGLKLTHTIDWSWWLISIPVWGPAALALIVGAFAAVYVYMIEKLAQ